MLQLRIDASDFVEQSAISPGEMDGFKALLLDRLAAGFQEQWTNQVNESLHSTRQEYMRGMYVDRPDDDTVIMGVLASKSRLAVDIELGKDAFDEKIGFERSTKKTMKKNGTGWYLTIPFRHAVPTALGESSVFNSVMPVSVYQLARTEKKPLTKAQLPASLQTPGIRPGFNSAGRSFRPYQHKTARYEGLFRVPDEAEARGQYMTFRRVSDLSDPNSWIHPGFVPRNLLGKALEKTDVGSIVRQAKIDFFS
jgi:hypothetical protein